MAYLSIQAQLVNIVQTAINANFTTLVAAVTAADLGPTLSGTGPFTVFAPTDAAFVQIGQAALTDLLKPENKAKLVGILKYHVINGSLTSAQILSLTLPRNVTTLEGNSVRVSNNSNNLMVNNANVILRDVMATNGVIHVIDTVLMPPKPSNSAAYFGGNQQIFLLFVLTIIFPFLHL